MWKNVFYGYRWSKMWDIGGCGKVDVAFCSFYSVSFIILMPISILVRFVSFFTTSL